MAIDSLPLLATTLQLHPNIQVPGSYIFCDRSRFVSTLSNMSLLESRFHIADIQDILALVTLV